MDCVVNTEKYRTENDVAVWARAVVTELPGRGRVRLLLPDTGATLLVHWSALRHIRRQFTTAKALVSIRSLSLRVATGADSRKNRTTARLMFERASKSCRSRWMLITMG